MSTDLKVGYAFVNGSATAESAQRDALKCAGCSLIIQDEDVISGGKLVRRKLERTLFDLNERDVFVVASLDVLGDSMPYVVRAIEGLAERGVEFQSIADGIDTTEDGGSFYRFISALSRFERAARSRKTKVGMKAVSRHGRKLGRPRKLSELDQIEARRAYRKGQETIGSLAVKYDVTRAVIIRILDETGER